MTALISAIHRRTRNGRISQMTCQPKRVRKMADFETFTLSVSLNSSQMCTYFCKDLVKAASSTGRETPKYFLAQQQQQNQTIRNISSTSRLPDFCQTDTYFIIKVHIQVYPCHHVLECR